ncbi:hypothetical protein [Campylobacter sp. MIT 99-7217]|uniref:hypothetical protein n=1 Tax=Campylobacter sp. MIT 99-7217 TaxID=535091 RepID=UPI00163C0B4E|nr:hypothetical protein [Campylobacter sp. MIT 99-7217]
MKELVLSKKLNLALHITGELGDFVDEGLELLDELESDFNDERLESLKSIFYDMKELL